MQLPYDQSITSQPPFCLLVHWERREPPNCSLNLTCRRWWMHFGFMFSSEIINRNTLQYVLNTRCNHGSKQIAIRGYYFSLINAEQIQLYHRQTHTHGTWRRVVLQRKKNQRMGTCGHVLIFLYNIKLYFLLVLF